MNDGHPHGTQPENSDSCAGFNLGRVANCADPRWHRASHDRRLGKGRFLGDLGDRDLGQHGVFAERAGAHVVQDLLALVRETRGSVWHDTGPLRRANCLTQVRFARLDVGAVRIFGHVERDDMISGLDRGHTFAHLLDNTAALMAYDTGKQTFRIFAGQRENIRVA